MSRNLMMPNDNQHLTKRRGLERVWHTALHSHAGLRSAWREAAFRQEVILSAVMIPLACWLGETWVESAVLIAACAAVLVVEVLNTGLEVIVDRIGLEWNELSKRAKDLGSAAVFLSLTLCASLWMTAFWRFFNA